MPTLNQLRGLKASDRTQEEQKAISQQMGYQEKESEEPVVVTPQRQEPEVIPQPDTMSTAILQNALRYKQHLDEQYEQALAAKEQEYKVGKNLVNSTANSYLDSLSNEVSSYYKKYKGTDKLPLSDEQKKQLAATYDAKKATYGEDNANVWLDNQYKDIVGNNQSWWEQGLNAVSHLIPAIEGGAIQAFGNLYGALEPLLGAIDSDMELPDNPDMGWWDQYVDHIIDNPITRYGRDVEHAGASNVIQGVANLFGIMDESAAERIKAESSGLDVIVNANYYCEYASTGKRVKGKVPVFENHEVSLCLPSHVVQNMFLPVVWLRLYRRDFLLNNAILFPRGLQFSEDAFFTSLAAAYLSNEYVFKGPYYHYQKREGSLSNIPNSGYLSIIAFRNLYHELQKRRLSHEGLRLFYSGPILLDSAEKFCQVKEFLMEIEQEVNNYRELYAPFDLYLLSLLASCPNYEEFSKNYSPNMMLDFVKSLNMKK